MIPKLRLSFLVLTPLFFIAPRPASAAAEGARTTQKPSQLDVTTLGDSNVFLLEGDPFRLEQDESAEKAEEKPKTSPPPTSKESDAKPAQQVAEKKEEEKPSTELLTDAEIAVLTPKELELYQSFTKTAMINDKLNAKDENLLNTTKLLRARIIEERRFKAAALPPAAVMTFAEFNNLPLFQQRKFCVDYPVDAPIVEGDARAGEIDNSPNAQTGLKNTGKNPVTQPNPEAPAADTAWSKKDRQNACRKLPPEVPGKIDPKPAGTQNGNGVNANLAAGKDKQKEKAPADAPLKKREGETDVKKDNPWLAKEAVVEAVKGAMIGGLLGSLFGPVGMVVGAIAVAGAFYGANLYFTAQDKADKDK